MKPWHKCEFQLEEYFEKVVDIYNKTKSKESEEVGSCLITMIALCQDVDQLDSEKEQQKFWDNIQSDINELLEATNHFLQGKD